MSEDEAFLLTIQSAPGDRTVKLAYADWLDERDDPRARYLRLHCQFLAFFETGDPQAPDLRRQMVELRRTMPPPWLALLGDYRAVPDEYEPLHIERVAQRLDRYVSYADNQAYECEMAAAVEHGLTAAVAYVESRSRQRGNFLDIKYHLHVRDTTGREAAWEVETYNPYFGCRVRFLEWYGDVVFIIYREKHTTYIARFGLDTPAEYKRIEDDWVLDGPHIGYMGYEETTVRRFAVPSLRPLPPLSKAQAMEWELWPER